MSIEIKNLNFIYNEGTPFERQALKDINLTIEESELVGLIGHTGSGKSTLIQHFNGLLKPTSGSIVVDGEDLFKEKKTVLDIRKKIGLVFQYPEHQLFEETIGKDIAFGPTNLGLNEDEVQKRVKESMELVGLNYDNMVDRSPFELSGGQKRRVAIAGVLAMNPKVLILDEPTAGLDPKGRDEIFNQIKELYDRKKLTIIVVSHSMEDMANLVNRLIVMYRGEVYMTGKPKEIFERAEELEAIGLGVPQIKKLMIKLKELGKIKDDNAITIEEAKKIIINELRS